MGVPRKIGGTQRCHVLATEFVCWSKVKAVGSRFLLRKIVRKSAFPTRAESQPGHARSGEELIVAETSARHLRSTFQKTEKPTHDFAHIPRLAFPNHQNTPPKAAKAPDITPISLYILMQLFTPIVNIRYRAIAPAPALVAMPETSMNKDQLHAVWKNDIGLSRQISHM